VYASTTVFLAVSTGIGGWWFTNFIFHPWKEVQELRRKSRFEIIYWLTSCRETPAGARGAFRKIAFELLALNDTSPNWFRRLLQFSSYDLTEAANGTIGDRNPFCGRSRRAISKAGCGNWRKIRRRAAKTRRRAAIIGLGGLTRPPVETSSPLPKS
jgi:hypothetical protein